MSAKLCLYRILSCFYLLIPHKGLKCSNVLFVLSRFRCQHSNTVLLKSCNIVKSLFDIKGSNNNVEFLNRADSLYVYQCPTLYDAHIQIIGNSNKIYIGSGAILYHLHIVVRGKNNVIKIGEKVTLNGATLVCMGGG